MSAAYLQLRARNPAITRAEIESRLSQSRTIVKTSLMRQTLHLIPTDEFQIYIAAMRQVRIAGALRVMARFAIARAEAEGLTPIIMEALAVGPLRRAAIAAALRSKSGKRVHAWMEACWSHVRLPVAEGLVCYGPAERNDATFIRVDQWLPKLKRQAISAVEAQCMLLRKYLRAYGPATIGDFSHWAGLPLREIKTLPALIENELAEVLLDGKKCILLREDVALLEKRGEKETCIRLLPNFDPYLLAHRGKDHLLAREHYKRVYRNQGWISPVVLVNGTIAAVWSYELQAKIVTINIEPFGKLSKPQRAAIKREAENFADFFHRSLILNVAKHIPLQPES